MKTKSIIAYLFALMLLLFQSCNKNYLDIQTLADFEAYIEDEMEYEHIPALSILIFKEDSILYENYFGKSNVEQNIPLLNNHVFLLASVSKVVTATALLQLYEEGLFALEDNINDFLDFEVNVPGHAEPITFKMLLTHTSGIEDGSAMDSQYYYGEDSPTSLDYFLENYLVPGGIYYSASENFYNFKPGTKHAYSNMGNALIAVLVEQISGQDFNTYCKENIFIPLEMSNTFWRLDEIEQTIVQPYDYVGGQNEAIEHYTFTDYPNGGLRSTVGDYFKLASALLQGGTFNNYALLEPSTTAQMITPQIPDIDDEVGLHMFLMNNQYQLWGHDGGEQGVATIFGFNAETKVGALIFTNQGETDLDEILEEAYKLGLNL
jgi:CubicO group peptidase (beta-lactamase class C family)